MDDVVSGRQWEDGVLGSRGRKAWAVGAALSALALVALAPLRRAHAEDASDVGFAAAPLERDMDRMFSGREESPSFAFRFRPGSQAENGHTELAQKLEDVCRKIRARLDLKPQGKIKVFLYDTTGELMHLTGKTADGAIAIGESLHVPLDRQELAPALARLFEPDWGRAGDKVGGGLEPGRRYKLRVLVRGGNLEGFLDGKPFAKAQVDAQPGTIAFGVEGGRLTLKDMKLRAAPADPKKDPDTAWRFPLRGDAVQAWNPDYPARWKLENETLECVRYGEQSKNRIEGAALKDLEIETEMRFSEGASAVLELFARKDGGATHLYFTPRAVVIETIVGGKRTKLQLATGPRPPLREGFVEALAAEIAGENLHTRARALLDRSFVPKLDHLLKDPLPHEGTDLARRKLLLGSFVAFCIDTSGKFGIARYRDFHFSDLADATTPLGAPEALESAWQAALRDAKRTPDEAKKIERELGLDVLGDPTKWKDLTADAKAQKFKTSGGGRFGATDDGLAWHGSPTGAAGVAVLTDPAPGKGAARATVRFGEDSWVRLVLIARDGNKPSAALIAGTGAALVGTDDAISAKTAFPLDANRWYDAVFVIDGAGSGRVYLDGRLVAEGQGLAAGPGIWQIECKGRRVEVRGVATRKLD